MASIKFDITGNANGYVAATRQAEAATKSMVGNIAEQGKQLDETFKKIATSAGALFTVQMASQFSTKVAQVRGEFQQLEVAFETMLQSKEKADALMAQVVDTAAKTPFDLQGVANGAKQLLAYGVASEEVNDTLIRLGDIAAGLSIPLNDLVYLYGTTMTQGRLFTQDLRQFQGRGIPLADELAKQFGVTKDAVAGLVTAGKVGFPEVEKAIKSMTGEGGKFNNLMAKQSKTITGQISNLEDAIDQMFNQIGQSSEGVISNAIGAASSLVENYEKVGRIIGDMVIAYGTYKAVLISINAVKKAHIAYIAAETTAKRLSIKTTKEVTAANVLLNKAMKALNKTMMLNPYVLAATAVAGLVVGVIGLTRALDSEKNAHQNVAKAIDEQNQKLEDNRTKAEELMRTVSDEASTEMQRVQALEELRKLYPGLFKEMSDQEIKTLSQVKATKMLTEETERLREEELKRSIQQKTASLTATKEVPILDPESGLQIGTKTVGMSENYIKTTRREIELLQEELDKLIKLREQAEFNQQPKEVQIVTLQGQIEKLKEENAELDKQIKIALAKKFTLNELGNLNFDWSQSGNADAMLAQQEANQKVIEDLEKKLKEIQNAPTKNTGGTGKGKKEHKAIKELKTYEAAVNATRKIQDIEHRANVSHLETIENDRERERKIREEENEKEIQDIERQKEDYINALTKAKVEELVAKKQKNIDVAAIRKEMESRADVKLFDDIITNTTTKQEKQTADLVKTELLAYQEMLSSYGSYYSQKLAIATLYEEKIRKAATDEEKAMLRQQMANEQSDIETKALERNLNFEGVFSGLGGMFKEVVAPALADAKAYMKTEKFKESDLQSRQTFIQTVNELEQSIGGVESDFNTLGHQVNQYKDALRLQTEAERLYKVAYEDLVVAQDNYSKALQTGDSAAIASAEIELNKAKETEAAQREFLEAQELAVSEYQQAMTTSAVTIKSAMNGVVSGLQKLSSGSLSGVYEGLIELGENADKLTGKLGDALGKMAEKLQNLKIVGFIFQILDLLRDGIGNFISGLLDSIAGVISGILKEIFSGQIFITIGEAIAKAIYDIIDGLFGGFLTVWLDKAITTRAERQEELKKSNEDLDKSLEKLGRDLDKLYSKDAANNLRDQNAELQSQKDNYDKLIEIERERKKPDEEQIAEWEAAMNEIELQIEDNAEKAKEAINGISFDSFRDKFLDALLDMENGSKALADDIQEDIRRAMFDALLTDDEFESNLRGLYDSLANAIETGNSSEIDRIKAAIIDLYEGQETKAKEIDEKLGYKEQSDREASEKGIARASQDSIDELNGIMTNIQSHTFSINQQMASVVNIASQILTKVTSIDANTSRLGAIENDMKLMREDISTIATRGIVMR